MLPAFVQPHGVVVERLDAAQLVDHLEIVLSDSATLLKKHISLSEPTGPPSALAPLSEMTMISVLSSLAGLFQKLEACVRSDDR